MNRETLPNPASTDYVIQRFSLDVNEAELWLKPTGLQNVPPGFQPFIRVVGNVMEFGIERVPAAGSAPAPVAKADGLDGLSIPDLQTKCARKGIAYAADDTKTTLVMKLRGKLS